MLNAQQIADLVVTAFEGGSNYWIDKVRSVDGKPLINHQAYSEASVYEQPYEFLIWADEDDTQYHLIPATVTRGTELLLKEYPKRFASIISEDFDAEDADVWLQLCLFGEIVYG